MDELTRQVRRVQRRLAAERFLAVLGWCLTSTLLLAAAAVVADKYRPLGLDWRCWPIGAALAGFAAAMLWTFVTSRRGLDAAVELDRRYGLKERVSSSLALAAHERDSDAGRALMADAVRCVERIDVAEKFRVRPPRWLLLPIVPAAAIVAAALLLEPASAKKQAEAATNRPTIEAQVKRSAEGLKRKLVEKRQQAKKQDLPEAERLFKRLEDATKDLAAKPDRQQAMAKLNDLARELQARRRELSGAEGARQQLEQLKDIDKGPADKLAQALRKGDLDKAIGELEKLRKELADGKLGAEEKEALAKQMDQMKDKLAKLAAARDAAEKELEKQLEQAKAEGRQADAEAAQRRLDQLQQQAGQMQQMADAAKQLGQCAQCLRDGDAQQAQDALDKMQQGLENLKQELNEMEMLDGAMEQLADAKKGLGEAGGMGDGDKAGGGAGDGQEQGLAGQQEGVGMPGNGIGSQASPGVLSDGKGLDAKYYDSQVRQKVGPGAADVIGTAAGPNQRGSVQQEIESDFQSVREGKADPLTGRQIPRKHREHVKEYFERLQGK